MTYALTLAAMVGFFLLACVICAAIIRLITRALFPKRTAHDLAERADLATELRGLRRAARELRRAAS